METPTGPDAPPAEQPLNVEVSRAAEDVVVLHVVGEIDLLTASQLGERLREQFVPENRALVLDLTGVSFMGSSGLAEIVSASQTEPLKLVLVATNRAVLRPLEATGLLSMLTVYDTVDDAVAGVRAP